MAEKQQNIVCGAAYKYAQMDANGEIYFCCPPWIGFYSIGNINEHSFSEIWNGEKARIFRRQFIENNFTICKTDICVRDAIGDDFKYPPESDIAPKPEYFFFNYDSICNVRCIFCKDKNSKHNKRFDYFEENMDSLLDDMLENVKVVIPSISGESLFSPSTVNLIKKINSKFPDIKYSITSNGLMVTEENLKKLGILSRIYQFCISVHATTKQTYNKLVENGDFDLLKNNLKYISRLKKDGIITDFQMNFVINTYNYKEMPRFVEWAYELGANATFWKLLDSEINKKTFNKLNIFDVNHPKYNDFCEVIKNPLFKTENCNIADSILNMQSVKKSFIKRITDEIKYRI